MTVKTMPSGNYTHDGLFYRVGARQPAADEFEATLVAANAALEKIRLDANLTPRGKAERSAAVRALTLKRLDEIDKKHVQPLRRARDLSEGMLDRPHRLRLPSGVSLEEAQRQAVDVRRLALSKSPEERRQLYLQACRDNDVVTVRAMEEAAPSLGLLGPNRDETLGEGRELHGSARAPKTYAALQEERAVVASLEGDLVRLRREYGDVPSSGTG